VHLLKSGLAAAIRQLEHLGIGVAFDFAILQFHAVSSLASVNARQTNYLVDPKVHPCLDIKESCKMLNLVLDIDLDL
jgi:hypothetical protein